MKQNIKRKWIVLLLMLCSVTLFNVFITGIGFSVTHASAETEIPAETNLTFSLNKDNSGYKIIARNKQITEAIIPAYYKGLPVTEISDNGFISCTKLTKVWIPYTVTKIGNNAFANCSSLKEINGMSCVSTIGNNAFAMCKSLDNLILPHSITTLGSTILRNNPNTVYSRLPESDMKALNANWMMSSESTVVVYGNELVLDEVHDDDETLIGYAITRTQNLNSNVDFVLGDTYNGLPLLEIKSWAFGFSIFNTFTLRHGEIVPDADESVTSNLSMYNSANEDCNHVINIESDAFISMDVTDINLLVDITFFDANTTDSDCEFEDGYSTDIFSSSTVRRIILPNNITMLPRSTFSDCWNLREISNTDVNIDVNHLSSNIISIGSNAFTGCKSLINLYIPSSIVNMGNSVFNQWGDSNVLQKIHFDDFYEAPVGYENYNWNINWLGTTYNNVEVVFKTIKVMLDKEGGNSGTDSIEVMYHHDMPEALAPKRDFYNFGGYYSERNGQGTQYYDENMTSNTIWDKKSNTILYAYWVPYTYMVTFDKQGGTGGSDFIKASYGQSMPSAIAPEKTGYEFLGYWGLSDGTDIQYYDKNMNSLNIWENHQDTILMAKWQKRSYNVILDPQGGTGGVIYITTTYNDIMPPAPQTSMIGWTFNGYYTEQSGQGTKFYNDDMSSAHNWDIDEKNVILYAYWTQNSYTLTFDMQGGTNGTPSATPIYYLGDLPNVTAPKRTGYLFKGYFEKTNGEGKKYYNADMTTSYVYDVDYNLTIYAYWKPIEYKITYSVADLKGIPSDYVNPNPSKYTIEDLPLNIIPIECNGYRIDWAIDTIDSLTGDVKIEGTVTAIIYSITYDLNGGVSNGGNPDTYTVEDSVVLKDAEHESMCFSGWTLNGAKITNLNGKTGNLMLKATWIEYRTIHIKNAFTTLQVTDKKVQIVFDVYFSTNCTINISANTIAVGITGLSSNSVYNMNINIKSRTSDFSLMLYSIRIKAHSNSNAIRMDSISTLNLYTYRVVTIQGCTAKSPVATVLPEKGVAAISCGKLVIQRSDGLFIIGGQGEDGSSNTSEYGGHGGDGAPGIIVKSDAYILCNNVAITGGAGGKGGDGLYQGYGGGGAYPVVKNSGSEAPVYVLKEAINIVLKRGSNGENGNGLPPEAGEIIRPTDPSNPVISPIDYPVGGDIAIPEPPFIPTPPIL